MSAVVAILTRSPSDPRLKARIAEVLPPFDQRRELVLAFIDDLVARVSALPDVTLKVAVTPPLEGFRLARPWIPWHQLLVQRGAVFGDRLRHVAEDLAVAGFAHIVLLGADVPDVPQAAIEDALRRLRDDPGAVVTGPSGDGSFYLLGFTVIQHEVPDLFTNVRWGTAQMLDDVETAARSLGRVVSRVVEWHDVDRPEDLQALVARLKANPGSASNTAEILRSLSLL